MRPHRTKKNSTTFSRRSGRHSPRKVTHSLHARPGLTARQLSVVAAAILEFTKGVRGRGIRETFPESYHARISPVKGQAGGHLVSRPTVRRSAPSAATLSSMADCVDRRFARSLYNHRQGHEHVSFGKLRQPSRMQIATTRLFHSQ